MYEISFPYQIFVPMACRLSIVSSFFLIFFVVPRVTAKLNSIRRFWMEKYEIFCRRKFLLPQVFKACLEISAVRNVLAAASRAIVQWKNGACLIEDSDGSIRVSGEPAFPRLFEHRVRSLCACERLRTIAVVFYLSFLLFSVVVVGFSCFQM